MPLLRLRPSTALRRRSDASAQALTVEEFEKVQGDLHAEGEILNLPGWQTIKCKESDEDIIIQATPTTVPTVPCGCGAPAAEFQRWGFTRPTYVHDLPIRCKRTRVYFKRHRFRCAGCGKTLQPLVPGIDERHALTLRLAEYVEREAFSIFRTFADIADEVGVNEKSVRDIFTAGAERREKDRLIATPEWLAVDEVYLGTGEHCVVSDPLGQRVLDLLPDNRQVTLAKWLLQLPNRHRVRVVTMDMYGAYKFAVGQVLSQARIVVDRYHVHNLLNVALKDVLRVVRDSMSPSEQQKYMRDPSLLLKSRFNLSDVGERVNQKQVVERWFKDVPSLGSAYTLKERLSDILQLSERQKAEEALDVWLEQVSEFVEAFSSKYRKYLKDGQPFSNVLTTVSKWRGQILNYVDYKDHFKSISKLKVTNAFAELANRQIKTAYRLGSGYAYEVIRAKVVHGGITVRRRLPHPLDEKTLRVARSRSARRGKKKRLDISPEANVARLERAREEMDETKGLIPNSYENEGWADRFGSLEQLKLNLGANEQEVGGKKIRRRCGKEPRQPPDTPPRRARRRFKANRDQLKMF